MDQDWEKIQHQRDLDKIKRIKKCNKRSNICLFLGLGTFFLTFTVFGDIIKKLLLSAKAMTEASQKITAGGLLSEINMGSVIALGLLIIIVMFFMFRAMFRWEEAEDIAATRFNWIPDEEEIGYIEQRFDNGMVRYILTAISPVDTETIEVDSKEVRIRSDEGTAVCNFNKCGYSQLSNYGTKQLAYYLASHSFPEGFVIYQTKVAPVGASRYLGGVTDIGGEEPPKPEAVKRFTKMLSWLAVQLQEILRLKTSFKMPEPEPGPSPADSGQIVINKGYVPDKEDMLPL